MIDDSADTHVIVEARLGGSNMILHGAMDGNEGLALAEAINPDLILLDIDMPDMNGFEVLWRLKASALTANTPVIFLTGASEVRVKVQAFDLGAMDYITKPFEAAELSARVRAALRTKRYQDLLAERAHIDGLTGLWNRTYFDRRLAEEAAAFGRYGRWLAVVMVDIDHLRQINDIYGHPFGDRVLERVGDVLSTILRMPDAPFRTASDEFACLLTSTDSAGAMVAAEQLRRGIAGITLVHKGSPVGITASFGIAAVDRIHAIGEDIPAALVAAATSGLATAKAEGRNCCIDGTIEMPELPSITA